MDLSGGASSGDCAGGFFHADGYRGGSQSLLENFTQGRYIGVPILQWLGLAYEPGPAQAAEASPYPQMRRWLRE